MGKPGKLMIKKNYAFGEYFSPRDILNIARKKMKCVNWWLLMLPIRALMFLFNMLLSIAVYPIFVLNKFFCKIKVDFTSNDAITKTAMAFIKIAHDISYILYRITMPILGFCVTVYKIFPSRVVYFSNQTTLLYAEDLSEIKAKYKTSFYENIEKIAQTNQDSYSHSEISDLFEADFYFLVNDMMPQLQDEI